MTYCPKSSYKRHQFYIGAFKSSKSYSEYLSYITKFLFDPDISPNNDDDCELFRDLVFEGRHGKVHIGYYHEQCERLHSRKRIRIIHRLARCSEFMIKHNSLFVEDMFHYLFKKHSDIVEELMSYLVPESKLLFIQVAIKYPEVVRKIPKLKFYLLYT